MNLVFCLAWLHRQRIYTPSDEEIWLQMRRGYSSGLPCQKTLGNVFSFHSVYPSLKCREHGCSLPAVSLYILWYMDSLEECIPSSLVVQNAQITAFASPPFGCPFILARVIARLALAPCLFSFQHLCGMQYLFRA